MNSEQSMAEKYKRNAKMLTISNLLLVLGVFLHMWNDHRDSQPQPAPSEQSKLCLESRMFNPVDFSPTKQNQLD